MRKVGFGPFARVRVGATDRAPGEENAGRREQRDGAAAGGRGVVARAVGGRVVNRRRPAHNLHSTAAPPCLAGHPIADRAGVPDRRTPRISNSEAPSTYRRPPSLIRGSATKPPFLSYPCSLGRAPRSRRWRQLSSAHPRPLPAEGRTSAFSRDTAHYGRRGDSGMKPCRAVACPRHVATARDGRSGKLDSDSASRALAVFLLRHPTGGEAAEEQTGPRRRARPSRHRLRGVSVPGNERGDGLQATFSVFSMKSASRPEQRKVGRRCTMLVTPSHWRDLAPENKEGPRRRSMALRPWAATDVPYLAHTDMPRQSRPGAR